VLAREAILNNPEIVKLLRAHFVAVAIDNVANLNMTAAEKAFLADKGFKFCTHGMSVFTAGGQVLGMGGGFEPDQVRQMLAKALDRYRPEESVSVPPRDDKDPGLQKPPAGTLVLYVTWKVVGEYDRTRSPRLTPTDRYNRQVQDSMGVDRLWVREDEAEALAGGAFPESLRKRVLPHLTYTLAGGRDGKVKSFDLGVRGGRLAGSFQAAGGEPCQLRGVVAIKDGKVTRFDLVAKGLGTWVEDCGFSACLRMVPRGDKVPVVVLFSLADPQDELARVPPYRVNHNGYLR
jgi:hypothetical protein